MADDGFNGTTLTVVGTSATGIRDISISKSGAKVQLSGAEANQKEYGTGVPDVEVSITVVGVLAVDVGDVGATTITWNDGSSDSLTNSIVVSVDTSGSEDSEITTTVTVAPAPAAA